MREGTNPALGRTRCEYNGIRYRSKWEAEAAEIFTRFGVPFEYERRDESTGTFPDFYFPETDLYFEIHPDKWGPKALPRNGFLVKTQSEVGVAALIICRMHDRDKVNACFQAMTKQALKGKYRLCMRIAEYLRQMIQERDDENGAL
jgi:hypothetical protein